MVLSFFLFLILLPSQGILKYHHTQPRRFDSKNYGGFHKRLKDLILPRPKRQVVSRHKADVIGNPDVIFLFQRPGLTESDLRHIHAFIDQAINALSRIGVRSSRVAVSFFTVLAYHPIKWNNCCRLGRRGLVKKVNSLDFEYYILKRSFDETIHFDRDPESIDVRYGFQNVREKYLSSNEAKKKPVLLVFVGNLKAMRSSLALLDAAVEEIEACKKNGAWLMMVLVDDRRNLKKRRGVKALLEATRTGKRRKKDGTESDISNILKDHVYFSTSNDGSGTGGRFAGRLVRPRINRLPAGESSLDLSLFYAQALASRPEYGFSIQSYADLNQASFANLFTDLLTTPYTWFGDGNVVSTCPGTYHVIDRAIWSPHYFSTMLYPILLDCSWTITVRKGYYAILIFDFFNTETRFDYVTIYNGFEIKEKDLLAKLSGYYNIQDLPPIRSSDQHMLVHFQSDNKQNFAGFHATWISKSIIKRLTAAEIVFLVDVSGSIRDKHLIPVRKWITEAAKFLYFPGDIPDPVRAAAPPSGPLAAGDGRLSNIGLVTFDHSTTIVSDITDVSVSRKIFLQRVNNLPQTRGNTYVGNALDVARVKQFYAVDGEENFIRFDEDGNFKAQLLIDGRSSECNKVSIPARILFLFTDGFFLDNPKQAAERLCTSNILPVIIRIGKYNMRNIKKIAVSCGILTHQRIPLPELMLFIRCKLGMNRNITGIIDEPVSPHGGVTEEPQPTTTHTVTLSPEIIYVYPEIKKFNYWGLFVLLAVICLIEFLLQSSIVFFNFCLPASVVLHPDDQKKILDHVEPVSDSDTPLPVPVNSFFTKYSVKEEK